MTPQTDSVYDALEKIFHEPNRLAIMSAVCAADRGGLSFNEIKDACSLTDGNLNRHLKVLAEAKAVRIEKRFVDDKPRTTVFITRTGLERFNDYLGALSEVLQKAQTSLAAEHQDAGTSALLAKPARRKA